MLRSCLQSHRPLTKDQSQSKHCSLDVDMQSGLLQTCKAYSSALTISNFQADPPSTLLIVVFYAVHGLLRHRQFGSRRVLIMAPHVYQARSEKSSVRHPTGRAQLLTDQSRRRLGQTGCSEHRARYGICASPDLEPGYVPARRLLEIANCYKLAECVLSCMHICSDLELCQRLPLLSQKLDVSLL